MERFERDIQAWVASEPGVSYAFVQKLTDNAITPLDETNAWWGVFKRACDAMYVAAATAADAMMRPGGGGRRAGAARKTVIGRLARTVIVGTAMARACR